VTVQDSSVPIVTAPANITVAATNASGTTNTIAAIATFLASATATDTVDGERTVTHDAPATFPLGPTIVTFSATDLSGNTGQAQATVNITDQSPPVISLVGASSMTLNVGDIFNDPGHTVTDNVNADLIATVTGSVNTAVVGTYPLNYNVIDTAGNAALQVTRSISVQDNAAPVVTPPANITVAATNAAGTANTVATINTFLNAATATDAIDGVRTVSHDAPATFPLSITTVTFSATDLSGNTGQATATVTITDQTPPVISLIGGSSMTLNVGDIFSDPGSSVSDNVDVGLVATVSGNVNTAIPAIYTLNYNISDAAGNAAIIVTRSVSVQDSAAPVVTPPANITVAATDAAGTANTVAAITTFLNATTATDAVDGSRPVSHNAPVTFPLGITTVTFSATDLSTNTGQAQATITITDQSPPVISLIGASSMTFNVGDIFSDPGHSVTDNVNAGLIATVTGSVNTATVGTYPLNYNVSDTAGNVALPITRTVSVVDNVSPDVIAPTNIIVAATNANGTANSIIAINTFLNAATANDVVDGVRTVTHDAPAVFPLGIITVTFSANDLSGNTGQAQATVTITDQTPPVINIIGASSMTLNVGDIFTDPGHTVTDNVNVGLIASMTGSVNTAIVGLYTLTYNVSDVAGNTAVTVIRSISVQDSNAPVVTPPANIIVATTDANGTANTHGAIVAFLAAATANDAVDGVRTVSHNAPATFPLGITTVTFRATDLSDNIGQAQATVTIADQTPPVISLIGASSMTLNLGDIFTDPGASVSDNVNAGLSVSVTGSVNTAIVGLYTLTYNVSDVAGNAAIIVTRSVSVQDSAAPVVMPSANITVAATDASGTENTATAIATFLASATATDVVDGSRPVTHDAPVTFPLGITTVTFSATDLSANTGQAQSTVTITDLSPPVISLIGASSMTLNVGDIFSDPGASVSDNVNAGLIVSVTGSVNTAAVGTYPINYNVSDTAGNVAPEVTRTVSVVDNVSPDVTAPANITVAATDASGTTNTVAAIATFLASATATDAVDGVRTVTHDAPATFPLGPTIVTFSANDLSDNTGQAQATVNVTDQSPPVISLIGASSMTLNVGDIFNDPGHTVTDNVNADLIATVTGSVNTSAVGTYLLNYNVSDTAGNVALPITRTVSVVDNVSPDVIAPANITVAAIDASGTANTVATINTFLNAATATDAIDGVRTVSHDAPATFPLGITTVTFVATDLSANTGQAQATVTITDQTPPVINIIGASSMSFNVGDIFSDPGASVSDNVDVGLSASVTGSVNTAIVGLYTLTYNVSDVAGNTAVTVIRSISVQDSNAPIITPPANITVAATNASGTENTVTAINTFLNAATATDAIDGVRTVSHDAPATFPLSITTVTFSATDLSGNTGQATATVTITDQTPPVISLIGASSMTLNVGDIFNDPGSSVSDNVDVGLVATVIGNVNTAIPAIYTLSYNISDTAGNAAITVTRSVTVQDSSAPVVTPPANITVAAIDASGTANTVAAINTFLNAATATDAIDGMRTVSHDAPATFLLGITTVTFSATDLSGNIGQAQATVTITDQTPPVISLIGASSMTLNVGDVFTDPGTSVSDNVDAELIASVTGSVNTTIVGLYALIYNVSDVAGNAAVTVIRSISVQDSNAPVVTPPDNIIVAATDASGTENTTTAIATFLAAATAADVVDGSGPVTHDAPVTFPLGITTVTFSATDLSSNTGQAQATVTITDQSPPVISLIGTNSMTLNVGDIFSDPGHSVTDNVNAGLIATVTGSINTTAVGTYSLNYNVSDTAGNAASPITRTVSVVDNVSPDVTAPANITVATTDASGTANTVAAINTFLNSATATDAVDGVRTVSHDAPAIFPLGPTIVTFSSTDLSTNTGQAQATVTITDQSPPVINLIGASSISLNVGDIFSDSGASVSDNVDAGLSASVTGSVNTAIVGLYELTYNVSDAAGNVAAQVTRTVSVMDNLSPDITAPANIIVAATDTNGTANTQGDIVAFLASATATDVVDGVRSVNHNAPATFPLGITTVTFSATDLSANTAQSTATVTITDQTPPVIRLIGASLMTLNVGDVFTDPGHTVTDNVNAGLIVSVTGSVNTAIVGLYTLTYNVNDAAGNAAVTVTRNMNITTSVNAPPVITAPMDILIPSLGAVTPVPFGVVEAIDDEDGVILASPDYSGPFVPGRHPILWSATDSSGNTGFAIQFVDVLPLVEFLPEQLSEPGIMLSIPVRLNGLAAIYPVEVNYDVFEGSSSTPSDSGSILIVEGIDGNFAYMMPASGDITFEITSVMNAVKGPMATHKVTLINQNVAPLSRLEITQNSLLTRITAKDAGPVTVKTIVQDTNHLDSHSFDWSQTDNVLLASSPGLSDSQFTFEPSSLSPGLYKINVKVTDNGSPELSTRIETSFTVSKTAPVFIQNQDSDGDGVNDEVEGYDDSDNDGIPDYLDGVDNPSAMQGKEGVSDKWLLNVQPGLAIRLGDIPLLADQHTANITSQDIENIADSFGGVIPADTTDTFTNTGGYFDFEITGLTRVGQSVLIVLPQYAAIPANAVYRKYTTINGWMNFVEDSKNKLSSAVGEEGICPAPGDSAYQHNDGLVEGDYCVQLLIEDGGSNDTDSLKNGVIADPGGVAVATLKEPDPVIPAPANTSSGGGGGINILTLILLLGMFRLQLRYRNRKR
jgi:uncharacterized protein (UPF0147 family)